MPDACQLSKSAASLGAWRKSRRCPRRRCGRRRCHRSGCCGGARPTDRASTARLPLLRLLAASPARRIGAAPRRVQSKRAGRLFAEHADLSECAQQAIERVLVCLGRGRKGRDRLRALTKMIRCAASRPPRPASIRRGPQSCLGPSGWDSARARSQSSPLPRQRGALAAERRPGDRHRPGGGAPAGEPGAEPSACAQRMWRTAPSRRRSVWLPGEQGVRIDETERVPKRVLRIERPLSPRPCRDLAHRQMTVAAPGRQSAQSLRSAIDLVEILYGEVHMIEVRVGVTSISVASRAVQAKRHVAAREVVSPGRSRAPDCPRRVA